MASTGTPGTVKPPANGPKVGDIVEFTGSAHYYSANATKSSPCKPGKAKVTQAFNGKHPYHLIAVKGGGSTVYGWVDAADIAVEASAAIAKGSTVKVKAGAKTYTGGAWPLSSTPTPTRCWSCPGTGPSSARARRSPPPSTSRTSPLWGKITGR